jgi:hypothetical protein
MLKGIVDKGNNNCDYHRTKHCNMKRIALFLIVALFAATEASAGLLPNAKWGIKAGRDYQTNDINHTLFFMYRFHYLSWQQPCYQRLHYINSTYWVQL